MRVDAHQAPTQSTSGTINAAEVYTLPEFLSRVRWGRRAWTAAKRDGMRAVKACGRQYVVGRTFLEFLDKLAKEGE